MSSNLTLIGPDPVAPVPRPFGSKDARLRKSRRAEELSREIERVGDEIRKCEAEIGAWVAGDDATTGRLFRIRTERLQLEAYLRGLKFGLP
jgi:hypothetical protein